MYIPGALRIRNNLDNFLISSRDRIRLRESQDSYIVVLRAFGYLYPIRSTQAIVTKCEKEVAKVHLTSHLIHEIEVMGH